MNEIKLADRLYGDVVREVTPSKIELLREHAELLLDMATDAMTMSLEWRDAGTPSEDKCPNCGKHVFEDASASYYRNRSSSVQQKCMELAKKMLTEWYETHSEDSTPHIAAQHHIEKYIHARKKERKSS